MYYFATAAVQTSGEGEIRRGRQDGRIMWQGDYGDGGGHHEPYACAKVRNTPIQFCNI